MVSLYRDPDGEGILGPLTANNANTVVNITLNGPEEVEELKRRIAVMEENDEGTWKWEYLLWHMGQCYYLLSILFLQEERGVDNE